jgi:hypothetical protein
MLSLACGAAGGGVVGYLLVREQVRRSCPMSDEELGECRAWFEKSARRLGAIEWDQIMGSGRMIFIGFQREDGHIYPEDLEKMAHEREKKRRGVASGEGSADELSVVRAVARIADRDGSGRISAKEFLMVWTVFCHLTVAMNFGRGGDGGDKMDQVIFSLADADGNGTVEFSELVGWVDLLMAFNMIPEADRVDLTTMRARAAEEVAGKYLNDFGGADETGDAAGVLTRGQFVALSRALRVDRGLRRKFSLKPWS